MKGVAFLATIALIALLPTPIASHIVSWDEAIARVESTADKYRTYAREHGVTWAGAMYNEWHSRRHSCAILGRMLGHAEAIQHLEELDYPPLPANGDKIYAHSMLVFAISLENWVFSARRAVAASEVERIKIWNLDCVGDQGIPQTLAMPNPQAEADFVRDDTRLVVLGDIDTGFADRFRMALDANPGVEEILLGSNGGSVVDAVAAGRMIRARGLKTSLYYNCNSACPLVFLGGVERVVWASGGRFGLHQISSEGAAVSRDDEIYPLLSAYIAEMGGDPARIVHSMHSASPAELSYPDPNDYCELGLATWVQRICG